MRQLVSLTATGFACKTLCIGIGTNPNSDYFSLFDFDNNTGTVSNPINLPYERGGFGLSFSPDNSKLYAATWKAFSFGASDK